MYSKSKQFIKGGSLNIETYVEDYDFFNSELLYKLDCNSNYEEYIVTKYEHRWDLISLDIYGSEEYAWLLQYMNKITSEELIRGITLKYISKYNLTQITSAL